MILYRTALPLEISDNKAMYFGIGLGFIVPVDISEETIRELFSIPHSPKGIESSVNELLTILTGEKRT